MKSRGKNRHCDNARIDATPERRYKFEAARVKQQGAFARRGVQCERGGNIPRSHFQIRVRDAGFFGFAVSEVTESDARAVLLRSYTKKFI